MISMDNTYNFEETINSWKRYLQYSRNLSIHTVNSYYSDLNQLILFLKEYKNKEITLKDFIDLIKSDIRAWVLYRIKKSELPRTISRGLSSIKSFISYLTENKILENSELSNVKHPKIPKLLPRPLSIKQINDIISSVSDMKQTDWIIKRDKALIILIYSVGLRISEALSLNKKEFLTSRDCLNILGKGGKYRTVPIIPIVREAIDDYLDACEFKMSEALFVNNKGERLSASALQKLMRKIRNTLNLSEYVTPHALRHSCATHLMEYSGELREIQELLGHSSIVSTQIYADVAKKYITEVYDKCHPLSQENRKDN